MMVELPLGYCLFSYIEGRKPSAYAAEARVFKRLYDRISDRNQSLFRDSWVFGLWRALLIWGELHIVSIEKHTLLVNLTKQMENDQ